MVRKTKQQALATRDHLLDTAELVFQQRGVSRTTLGEIAQVAGLTRGAIYWHFENKADLFNAMVQRVRLPMEAPPVRAATTATKTAGNPLRALRTTLAAALRRLVDDPQVRRVFEIATHKVEYIDELQQVRERHVEVRRRHLAELERMLREAVAAGQLTLRVPTRTAALALHAMIDGLIQNWMLTPGSFDLVRTGRQALDICLAGVAAADQRTTP